MLFTAAAFLFTGALSPFLTPVWAQLPGERIIIERPAPRRDTGPLALSPHATACYAPVPETLPRYVQKACPAGTGFRPLSNLHAPHAVAVTLQKNNTNDNSAFVRSLLQILEREAPSVRLHIMATEAEWAAAHLAGYKNASWLASRRPVDLWPQDFFEVGVRGADAHASILALNYRGRYSGNDAAQLLTDSCREPLERIRDRQWAAHSGNHGGNFDLFPGDVLVSGSSMDTEVRASLTRMGTFTSFVLDTSWLDVGHVDEVVSVVSSTRGCGFALVIASPRKALELIDTHATESIGAPIPAGLPAAAEPFAPRPASDFKNTQLGATQQRLQARIDEELRRLKQTLATRTGCPQVPVIELPMLYSAETRAHGLIPNPVNMLVLGDLVIVPKPFHTGFEQEIEKSLRDHGLRVRFIDDRFYHFQGGDVHCATQTLRSCR